MGSVLIILFICLLLIGLPVAFTLAIVGATGLFFSSGMIGLEQLASISYSSLENFSLVALPLYILMGQILLVSGIGKDLYEMASKWFRHFPGGLAIATLFCCAIFAAISGSSVATAVTIGMIALPEMTSRGYKKRDVLGIVAAGGTLGILIPPSVPMIIYGTITDVSIGKLFIAGVIPGILLTTFFIIFASWKMRDIKEEPATWSERLIASRKAIWGLLVPMVVIGGIYGGAFTPTEAAAVGVVLSALVAIVIYKKFTLKDIKETLLSTMTTSTMILLIMVGAMVFGYILTDLRIPQEITNTISNLDVSKWIIMIIIILLLIALGLFLEVIAILVITLPILFPLILSLGFDPVWFAIIMVITMELAIITPPVGMNLFALKGIAKNTKIADVAIGAFPYAIIMILFIILLAVFPGIALWLPNMGGL